MSMVKIVVLPVVIALWAFAVPRLVVPSEGVAFGEIPAGEGASKSIDLTLLVPELLK